jgi:agmatinase
MLRRPDLSKFDEAAAGDSDAGVFGLPFSEDESSIVLLPAPWEPTTSYGKGTAGGPSAIRHASSQLDLFDPALSEHGLGAPWRFGIHMLELVEAHREWNEAASAGVSRASEASSETARAVAIAEVNALSAKFDRSLEERVSQLLDDGRGVGIVGGDHSVPLGPLRAFGGKYSEFGILHVDAHADLRAAYEGFKGSHASIMYNVLDQVPQVSSLVQVGIRDLCEEEFYRASDDPRVALHLDSRLRRRVMEGERWSALIAEVVAKLPTQVYISFDIDGLDPALCPGTGTPVPGGLSFHEAMDLILEVVRSGRTVIGFDLCEVSPSAGGEWDGNVGARVLYRLCGAMLYGAGARDGERGA